MKLFRNLIKSRKYFSSIEQLKLLRAKSGAPLIKCKEALTKFDDFDQAINYLKEKNLMSAMKYTEKINNEGIFTIRIDD